MPLREDVIDLHVDLFARVRLTDAIQIVAAVNRTSPSVADDVQTVERQVASGNGFIDSIALRRAGDKKVINAASVEISPERIPGTGRGVRRAYRHTSAVGRRVAGHLTEHTHMAQD